MTSTFDAEDYRLKVVTTTGIIADLTRNVAGDRANVLALVPEGADPHSYEPSLRDVRNIAYADLAFTNHLLLEEHNLIKSLDANLRPGIPNISLAEASEKYGAHIMPLMENLTLNTIWPGPSTGTIYNDDSSYFDDRNKVGLDCSGFMRWAWYEATGVDWGGVATGGMDSALTSHKFSRVTNGAYQAGDVFVYNGHTAMNLGGGKMVQVQGDIEGLNVRALRTSGTTGVYRYTGDGGTPVPPGNNPPDPNSVHIWANGVRIRKGPNTQSDVVTTVSDTYTRLSCQVRGEKVTAEGYTNDIWSFSPGLGGYVNNIYLSGPADFGLPNCSGDTPPPAGGKTIHIWGTDVNVRAAANTSSTAVKTVSDQDATFSCQARGQEVQDSGYTNDIWSYSSALGGYVSNIYLKGPADFGLATC
ncbi:metal ABC transporter solute-binding protein, Zn/Mn family [Renibacterium salmoninarum]|uniref:metal ABC transporter solute-binding protein, Zn/Mn family n=1 Tax=Renibacterium salmoninarum TaxID=1646 RepID=UPI0002F2F6E6|nr:zinc ABC transporter substrate-binding protein [Renibacterium salmoninarum]